MHFLHSYASIHVHKMYFTFPTTTFVILQHFSIAVNRNTYEVSASFRAFLFSVTSPHVRRLRTYVCIFMKSFSTKLACYFYNLHIVHICKFIMYIYTFLIFRFFFLSCIFSKFSHKNRRIYFPKFSRYDTFDFL